MLNPPRPSRRPSTCNILSRSFRGKPAITDVSLQIPVGSIFGLVGLNGAGKTTLIRHLVGALRALHGTVRVLGEDPVANSASVLRRVGYLTEEDTLPKWMRLGELIDFSRAIYPTWDSKYADQLCEMFALTRATRLSSLSKGGRARVGLLVAIAHRPQLLVLDEPSRGLDPIARSDILEAIIRTISEDGRTVLFSSHLLEEVDRVCDCIALMRDGEIVESLTTEQLENRYIEIVCRPPRDWRIPQGLAGFFGWQRLGDEWSAVLDSKITGVDPTQLAEQIGIGGQQNLIERREITLQRWFAARNHSTQTDDDATPLDEVTADV